MASGWLRTERARLVAAWLALALLIGVLFAPEAWSALSARWNSTTQSWAGKTFEIDARILHDGFLRTQTVGDVAGWFHGTWVGGPTVPFYRPISSLALYGTWRLFGDTHEGRYPLVNIVLHLLVIVQVFRVSLALLRHFGAGLPEVGAVATAAVFLTGAMGLDPLRTGANAAVTFMWKNMTDPLCALFALQAVASYLAAREKGGLWKVYLLLLGAFMCKEVALLVPFALAAIEAPDLLDAARRRPALARVLGLAAFSIGFQVLRIGFLDGLGFVYGKAHEHWPARLVDGLTVPLGSSFLSLNLLYVVPIVLAWLPFRLYGRLGRRTGCGAYAARWLALGLGVLAIQQAVSNPGLGLAESLAGGILLLVATPVAALAGPMLFPWVLDLSLRRSWPFVVFVYSWMLVTLVPNLFSPMPIHRGYMVTIALCWLAGFGICEGVERVAGKLRPTT